MARPCYQTTIVGSRRMAGVVCTGVEQFVVSGF